MSKSDAPPTPPEGRTVHGVDTVRRPEQASDQPDQANEGRATHAGDRGRQANIEQNTTHTGHQQDR